MNSSICVSTRCLNNVGNRFSKSDPLKEILLSKCMSKTAVIPTEKSSLLNLYKAFIQLESSTFSAKTLCKNNDGICNCNVNNHYVPKYLLNRVKHYTQEKQ